MRACDLNVAPTSVNEARRMAKLLKGMGVGCVAVEHGDPSVARQLVNVFEEEGVEAYTRVTLEISDWQRGIELVRRASRLYNIVVVKPKTAEAARLAARDPRVALLQLTPGMARYMDKSQAQMLREGGAAVEIRLLPLLYGGDPRSALRGLMIIARRAAAYEAVFVATSGARSAWELWHPAIVRGLLVSIGLPENIAKLAVTGYPRSIVRLKALKSLASEG
ncbi:RNase P subunit p30 family protein [Hyperthermus butylicus]|uniref:Ribonuclease P protein component 3 n=1 Tax=Hyperthermus butylicus (strain DSM 5456 / JCM 9403 / PLM1-5) TaxID=415426 RepID=A2BKA4_HYPBU|nr:RNase P subunit p30 family protein [Hyperthermus butylicus]ABM80415.1 RNase P subunit p30 [Hyperthermus butylicus DSM 5456]